jgi:hypothetical protein
VEEAVGLGLFRWVAVHVEEAVGLYDELFTADSCIIEKVRSSVYAVP